jgi:hypothetical protein
MNQDFSSVALRRTTKVKNGNQHRQSAVSAAPRHGVAWQDEEAIEIEIVDPEAVNIRAGDWRSA